MREFMKRTAFGVLTLMMMAAACLWQSSPVEAAENTKWFMTSIELKKGECVVNGYFTNDGDTAFTIKTMKFILNVSDAKTGEHIYSAAWRQRLNTPIVVSPGAQVWQYFSHIDKDCPRFAGKTIGDVQYSFSGD